MSVEFQPLINNLLIRLEPEPERSKLIHAHKATQDLVRFGLVLTVGPEVRDIRKGQRVLASITAGIELQEGVVMVAETSIYATCD
jgi:hypothetical protein